MWAQTSRIRIWDRNHDRATRTDKLGFGYACSTWRTFFLSFFVNTYHMADFAFCIFGLDCDLKGDSGSRRPTDCGQASGGPDKGHRPAGAQSTFLEQLIEEKKKKKGIALWSRAYLFSCSGFGAGAPQYPVHGGTTARKRKNARSQQKQLGKSSVGVQKKDSCARLSASFFSS